MNLANKFGTLFMFAFIVSNLKPAREFIYRKPVSVKDKVLLSIVFGIFGIIGTYFSVEFNGALINTRIIGVATGGLLGGPAVDLVKDIWIPMVIINSIGLALLFLVIENIFRDRDRIGAEQVNLSINIIDKLLPYIKGGLSEENSTVITDTIYEMTSFDEVTITAREKIIAHSGIHIENHEYGNKVNTERFNTIMESGETLQFDSTIISPIRDGDDIIGTVKYYKKPENIMNNVDVVDYMVKLIMEERLKKCIDRARLNMGKKTEEIKPAPAKKMTSLVVAKNDKLFLLKLKEIVYLEYIEGKIRVFTEKDEYSLNQTMKSFVEEKGNGFIRTHKSFIVNIDYIKEFKKKLNI